MGNTKIVVIGSGPGGYVAAIRAAQLGGDVVVIEEDKIGGTCLNVGCIPTKALLHTAELYENARHGEAYGVMADVRIDFGKAQKRKDSIVNQLVGGVNGLLKVNKIKVVKGHGTIVNKRQVKVESPGKDDVMLYADKIIIATGSVPFIPPIPGVESKHCVTSTGALEFKEIPKSMVIVGGGVIGVEIATMYSAMGTKVHVVEMLSEILPNMDVELVKMLKKQFIQKGIEFHTSAKVVKISDVDGGARVDVIDKEGKNIELKGEKVLLSVGRRTNVAGLGLDEVGIATDRGRILVDEKMETNVDGVYAIGDCNGQMMLAHVASYQGEVAAENALGHASKSSLRSNPSCVYTNPEFASVGITEEMAKEQNLSYKAGKFSLAGNGKSLIIGTEGMIKVIVGKEYGEILGVHILGPRATDLIGECALAVEMEATVDELIQTIHAHPTVSEAIKEAMLASDKRAIHMPNR